MNNIWKIRNFIGTGQTQSLHFWSWVWCPVSPCRWPKLKKLNHYLKKLKQSGSPNMSKPQLFSSPFFGKNRITFYPFALFLPFLLFLARNRVGSQVRGSKSKFDIAIFSYIIPGQLKLQKVCFQHFPLLHLWVTKDISEKF